MTKGIHKVHSFMLIALLLIVTVLAGCNSAKTQQTQSSSDNQTTTTPLTPSSPSTSEPESSATQAETVKLTLYFPNADGSALVPAQRTVEVSNQEIIKAMFKELSSPPSGLEPPLPKGTILRSAVVKDGVATLSLSSQFRTNFGGGSDAELMTIYSIVDSITNLPGVQSVQFLLEGQKQDAILGSLDTSVPLKSNPSLIRK
ncbi:sporulation and spore germination [Desulfosporosinus acididurans]|uniref:Sporulation and spore germination n=1 Tax=Desulfosporosinus acididurans TaxID=476652 RepID=A0A0J1FQX5_9FIRM|nr:GerMN domain-containing protein [Desulfosporosinus acididurans]KLU65900.1 sporulation and spore germination [Desulfosporosinus acididurans]